MHQEEGTKRPGGPTGRGREGRGRKAWAEFSSGGVPPTEGKKEAPQGLINTQASWTACAPWWSLNWMTLEIPLCLSASQCG